ncbi:amidohydrolase family protein [Pseudonocardia sp. CA-142604]|uniref:amidohydrolase family protein n=1 Tax=Pseudonocardia sp. CA-142604 TaxID=3240024 RepID=UPI003D8B2FDF
MSAATDTAVRTRPRQRTTCIDCDVHITMHSPAVLREHLPEQWRDRHDRYGGNPYHASLYPRMAKGAARGDAWPPTGGAPASDLPFLREQLLDQWDIEYAVLGPLVRADQSGMRNAEYAAALCRATNDWAAREWLDAEPRLRSSIVLPAEDTEYAVAEIERVAPDPRFVQVYMQIKTPLPMGNRKYWPIYESAARHGLPVGVHFGGVGGQPSTASGWASYYLEDHAGNAQSFQAQVVSLVFSGIFERLPDLRIVLIEGGIAWAPPLAWRMDAAFERMHDEVPHLSRRPSEYLAEHFWFTTQPVEEPPDPRSLLRVFEDFPALQKRVMFSSDYPHWDFDAPDQALRTVPFSPSVRAQIMSENSRALYGLPGDPASDGPR